MLYENFCIVDKNNVNVKTVWTDTPLATCAHLRYSAGFKRKSKERLHCRCEARTDESSPDSSPLNLGARTGVRVLSTTSPRDYTSGLAANTKVWVESRHLHHGSWIHELLECTQLLDTLQSGEDEGFESDRRGVLVLAPHCPIFKTFDDSGKRSKLPPIPSAE